FQFLSAKPLLIVLNLDEADLGQAQDAVKLAGLEGFLTGAATRAVPICAKIELEIAQLDEADRAAFMADLGLHESGLDRVIRASYDLLGYISFFTVGEDEFRATRRRCWPRARSTPTSHVDSSARKSSATSTCWRERRSPRAAITASSAS